ncbi:MAG: hypothetical protein AB1478_04200 [Nitrospirota bacterium]
MKYETTEGTEVFSVFSKKFLYKENTDKMEGVGDFSLVIVRLDRTIQKKGTGFPD